MNVDCISNDDIEGFSANIFTSGFLRLKKGKCCLLLVFHFTVICEYQNLLLPVMLHGHGTVYNVQHISCPLLILFHCACCFLHKTCFLSPNLFSLKMPLIFLHSTEEAPCSMKPSLTPPQTQTAFPMTFPIPT